ncbi:MAG: hypothetical protein MUP98_04040 [Candidatus Aminicenantes bacterium]|nr:hypothetical protein [Candidatus Aminicenantes bacterium]
MKKRLLIFMFLVLAGGFFTPSFAQFTEEEIAERGKWEKFLQEAEIVDFYQMTGPEAVTEPWVLTLEKDGVKRRALWKDALGRQKGFLESWKWEIAAYRIDKLLGLEMVPPTVEKRFRAERGSCQLWMEDTMTLEEKERKEIKTPSFKIFYWNRALYKQRTWDNLIANDDRHQGQFLITSDFRILLCDHSRSFRTTKNLTETLIYDENFKEGPRLMKEIPRTLYENIKLLTFDKIRNAVGEYLTKMEIEAVIKRKELIVDWIEKRIEEIGEDKVLY